MELRCQSLNNDTNYVEGEYYLYKAEVFHFSHKDYSKAAECYRKSICAFVESDVYHHYNIKNLQKGACCNEGEIFIKEKCKPILNRLLMLSLANCAEAMVAFCECSLILKNPVKNKDLFRLIKDAAELGNVEAQYKLADCYRYAIGVEKNLAKAVEFYQKAAEQGDEDAALELEYFYNSVKTQENGLKY